MKKPQFSEDLLTFIKEIFRGKSHLPDSISELNYWPDKADIFKYFKM